MAILSTILSVFGSGLGSLFSWAINLWEQHVQAEKQASDQMNQDIEAHANDGALSVADMQSAEGQIENLKQQAAQMDAAQPATEINDGTKTANPSV